LPYRSAGAPGRLIVIAVAVVLAGCGGGEAAPKPVAVKTVCALKNGSRVQVRGYLRLPARISLTDRAVIDLFTRRGGAGDRTSVELLLGTDPNQLERLEAGFTPTSLRVRGRDGTVATLIDTVVVVATVKRTGDTCVLADPTVTVVAK
jgi:hypothetical protein